MILFSKNYLRSWTPSTVTFGFLSILGVDVLSSAVTLSGAKVTRKEQQLKQLMVLEEQQAAQVLKQQQVIDQHERRQQEHQVYSTF